MKVWDKGKNTKFLELKELDYFPELTVFQGNIEIHDLKKNMEQVFSVLTGTIKSRVKVRLRNL